MSYTPSNPLATFEEFCTVPPKGKAKAKASTPASTPTRTSPASKSTESAAGADAAVQSAMPPLRAGDHRHQGARDQGRGRGHRYQATIESHTNTLQVILAPAPTPALRPPAPSASDASVLAGIDPACRAVMQEYSTPMGSARVAEDPSAKRAHIGVVIPPPFTYPTAPPAPDYTAAAFAPPAPRVRFCACVANGAPTSGVFWSTLHARVLFWPMDWEGQWNRNPLTLIDRVIGGNAVRAARFTSRSGTEDATAILIFDADARASWFIGAWNAMPQHETTEPLPGYTILSRTRRPKASFGSSWGGVAIVIRAVIPFESRDDLSGPDVMVIQTNKHLVYNAYLLPESPQWAGVLEKYPLELIPGGSLNDAGLNVGIRISLLAQADDLLIVSMSARGLRLKLSTLERWCASNFILVNTIKTIILIYDAVLNPLPTLLGTM
ncbi:hypothetical protein B0H14DRAFT_3501377 [Mycena olivaceomarginata]|nr:hypothetical protein B0H14DRAFT_3501377 [Mycena olivaceomarginata]